MKTIHVVAAIIMNAEGEFFCTQRGYGEWKDWWEFPGGKIEAGENAHEALKREIREELNCDIAIDKHLTTVEIDYPKFHLSMQCFLCSIDKNSKISLIEHEDAKWVDKNGLTSIDWLPADKYVVEQILSNVTNMP